MLIYLGENRIRAGRDIELHSEYNADVPCFTLIGISTSGVPLQVTWTMGSTQIPGGIPELRSSTQLAYFHRLTITGRVDENVNFTVSNGHSSYSAVFNLKKYNYRYTKQYDCH